MGFMEKLKNIFFEEEEDEEVKEELPLKEEKVIAKKVEVPKRKKEYTEIEVEKEEVEEVKHEEKKEVENNYVEYKKEIPKMPSELIFDDDDFILDTPKPKKEVEPYTKKVETNNIYKSRENRELYKKEESKVKKETPKYEYTKIVTETKETKTFTPSPIISPIYGILDKNYKKEEVKERKEIRISSRPVKMDLDSVRNKAFGDLEYDLFDNTDLKEEKEEIKEEKKKAPKREMKKIYNMSKGAKPSIERVTIGEADEYFNDLGLAYNTDYKDISKEINDGKIVEEEGESDRLEDNLFDLIESMYDKED